MDSLVTDISNTERKLLRSIKRRPGMYIGTLSLEYLQHFLNGYDYAIRECSYIEKRHILPDNFNDFVAYKLLGHNKTVLNYCSLIYKINTDEERAINMFFELVDECLISQGFKPITDSED